MYAGISVATNHPRTGGGASTFSVKQLGVTVAEVTISKRCNLHVYVMKLTRGATLDSLELQLNDYGLALESIDCHRGRRKLV